MMKVVNTTPGIGNPMTEEERKDFLANDKNKLLARIEFIYESQCIVKALFSRDRDELRTHQENALILG